MKRLLPRALQLSAFVWLMSCSHDDPLPEKPVEDDIYRIPVVVHVLHNGGPVGEGNNLTDERIIRQIEILNEDFRRKEGTRGYNDHPDGADAKIEFVLAQQDPSGLPTTGILRIDASTFDVPNLGYNQRHFAQYSYWDARRYVNIWTTPLPDELRCTILGSATYPLIDLPGLSTEEPPDGPYVEGIIINAAHFGESDIDCHARFGRTLTHEMGHFLGLLHTWGNGDCEFNDYCDDTPPVDQHVWGRTAFTGCSGETIMIENYMNYSDDEIMNTFTRDQVARMHYVLLNHVERNALLSSPGLEHP